MAFLHAHAQQFALKTGSCLNFSTIYSGNWVFSRLFFPVFILQISSDMRQAKKTISALVQREALAQRATAFCLFSA